MRKFKEVSDEEAERRYKFYAKYYTLHQCHLQTDLSKIYIFYLAIIKKISCRWIKCKIYFDKSSFDAWKLQNGYKEPIFQVEDEEKRKLFDSFTKF